MNTKMMLPLLFGVVVSLLSSTRTLGFVPLTMVRTIQSNRGRIQSVFQNTIKHATTLPSTSLFLSSSDEDEEQAEKIPIPPSTPVPDISDSSVDKIAAEAANAIREAESALSESINNEEDEIEIARRKAVEAQEIVAQQRLQKEATVRQIEAFVAGFGAFLFGGIAGGVMDIFLIENNLDIDIDLILPPSVLSVIFGVTTITLGQNDDETGAFVRSFFGGPLKQLTESIKTSIRNKVEETVDDIKATPDKIKVAFERKVQETTEEIKQIPDKVKEGIEAKVDETVEEIKAIPEKVQDAATEAVENAKDEISTAATRTVDEIKATPGRVVQEVENKVDQTVSDIKKNVEEVIGVPIKDLNKASNSVSSALPDTIPQPPEKSPSQPLIKVPEILKKPEPPKAKPPQVPPQKEEMAKLPDLTLPTPSKINLPKPPEINLPKTSVFNLPNPPDLSVPKTPVPPKEPPTKESKSKPSDNFVFSEVSLKGFVDDVRTTDKANMKSNEDRRAEEVALAKKKEHWRQSKQLRQRRGCRSNKLLLLRSRRKSKINRDNRQWVKRSLEQPFLLDYLEVVRQTLHHHQEHHQEFLLYPVGKEIVMDLYQGLFRARLPSVMVIL